MPGLQSVNIGPIEPPRSDPPHLTVALNLDRLWLTGFSQQLTPCPSWSGFIQVAVKGETHEKTRIEILPFINMDPSNPSTIIHSIVFRTRSM